ncbi:MAG: hypothetical protein H6726_19555 [Sandaracinaceae bacterium]|nr:hypothetical protein [Sandaracinaceae bacterium]
MNRTNKHAALAVIGGLMLGALGSGCGLGGPTELPAGFTGTKNIPGRFGGPTDATAWGPGCRGFVSTSPDHQIQNAAALPYVRFIVNGGQADTTLAVQLPDGTYRCNDDFEGVNPMVEGPLPAGLIKVWVGAYTSNATGNYRLGISTNAGTTAASLGAPAASSSSSSRRRRSSRRR